MFLKTIFKKPYVINFLILRMRTTRNVKVRVTQHAIDIKSPSVARDRINCLTDAGYKSSVSADDQQTKIEPSKIVHFTSRSSGLKEEKCNVYGRERRKPIIPSTSNCPPILTDIQNPCPFSRWASTTRLFSSPVASKFISCRVASIDRFSSAGPAIDSIHKKIYYAYIYVFIHI